MPSKRQRRTRQRRVEVPANVIALLNDSEPENTVRFFVIGCELRAAWNEVKDEILEAWAREEPGTRPRHWWRFDAPRQPTGNFPGCYYDGKLPEPRRRLGGIGTPSHECLAHVPAYDYGLPTSFVSPWEESYYNGRSVDIHGKPIGVEYRERHFAGLAIDPEDPPRFESEASYLDRLGLLLPGELERLTEADFEPEMIAAEAEPDEAA